MILLVYYLRFGYESFTSFNLNIAFFEHVFILLLKFLFQYFKFAFTIHLNSNYNHYLILHLNLEICDKNL